MRFQSKWLLASFLWAIPWLANASKLTTDVIKAMSNGAKVRFTEPWSGYYALPIDVESELNTPYSAMTNAMFSQVASYYDLLDGKRLRNGFDRSKCWMVIFRKECEHGKTTL